MSDPTRRELLAEITAIGQDIEATPIVDPADVELVADAIARDYCWDGIGAVAPVHAETFRRDARVALAALAAAGRLLPAGAKVWAE